jgi:hypothetical protein
MRCPRAAATAGKDADAGLSGRITPRDRLHTTELSSLIIIVYICPSSADAVDDADLRPLPLDLELLLLLLLLLLGVALISDLCLNLTITTHRAEVSRRKQDT